MSEFIKYKKFYSFVFLSSYLFLFTSGIFHYHNFILDSKNYYSQFISKPGDPYSDNQSICLITQLNSSLYSNSISGGSLIIHLVWHKNLIKPVVSDFIQNNLYYNFLLRAPPIS